MQAEVDKHLKGEVVRRTYAKQGSQGVKQLDGIVKQLRQELKVGDEDLQARIHSQTSDQYLIFSFSFFLYRYLFLCISMMNIQTNATKTICRVNGKEPTPPNTR